MANIGIFFGSDTGNTEKVAEKIAAKLALEPQDIAGTSSDIFDDYDVLILGTPTANYGEMQPDWDYFVPEMEEADLTGKKVALFGLGDQIDYPDSFLDAMGELAEMVEEAGGELIGEWPTDGYQFNDSRAVKDGKFVGLALDEDRQPELTDDRVATWLSTLGL
ncbi:flavodoxin FldA [Photobacterium gaetbulicola]|uniref:Flavodoxin n=1 Tax=Photobacterium gaetbulicola Gung47 TaxID=658445 RepID=A0A0C5W900_9GAMM|nr:flavodoxin FldA [Photobacterium gaetbulicola]AJR08046.1 flavodoxin FldA [Photobacterium gaetbulicola Gung47]PSU07734.1 flavodoxin FldA [Photobacterium gaetbulicola]